MHTLQRGYWRQKGLYFIELYCALCFLCFLGNLRCWNSWILSHSDRIADNNGDAAGRYGELDCISTGNLNYHQHRRLHLLAPWFRLHSPLLLALQGSPEVFLQARLLPRTLSKIRITCWCNQFILIDLLIFGLVTVHFYNPCMWLALPCLPLIYFQDNKLVDWDRSGLICCARVNNYFSVLCFKLIWLKFYTKWLMAISFTKARP